MLPLYHMTQPARDSSTRSAPLYTSRSPKSRPWISSGAKTPRSKEITPSRSMSTAKTSASLQWDRPSYLGAMTEGRRGAGEVPARFHTCEKLWRRLNTTRTWSEQDLTLKVFLSRSLPNCLDCLTAPVKPDTSPPAQPVWQFLLSAHKQNASQVNYVGAPFLFFFWFGRILLPSPK